MSQDGTDPAFGRALTQLMDELGVSVIELGRRLAALDDVPPARRAARARNARGQVQKWRRGENTPWNATRAKLERALEAEEGTLPRAPGSARQSRDSGLADISRKRLAEISSKLDEVLERVAETSASYEARLAKLEEQVDQILTLNETSFEILLASVARIEQLEAARSARPAPRRRKAS